MDNYSQVSVNSDLGKTLHNICSQIRHINSPDDRLKAMITGLMITFSSLKPEDPTDDETQSYLHHTYDILNGLINDVNVLSHHQCNHVNYEKVSNSNDSTDSQSSDSDNDDHHDHNHKQTFPSQQDLGWQTKTELNDSDEDDDDDIIPVTTKNSD